MHLLRFAIVAVLALILTSLLQSTSVARPDTPIALYGQAPGEISSVKVTVLPTMERPGTVERPLRIDDASYTISGRAWAVQVPLDRIPAPFVRPGGLVDFLVEATGPDGTWSNQVSARMVDVVGTNSARWLPAVTSESLVATSSSRSGLDRGPIAARLQAALDDDVTEVEDDGVELPLARSLPCSVRDVYVSDDTKTRATTIGTTYPLGKSTAWMTVSASKGAGYGVAAKVIGGSGGFYANGSKFVKTGWGFTWDENKASRSYRKGIRYRWVVFYCSEGYNIGKWMPDAETGGVGENLNIARPDFPNDAPHCANVVQGVWLRNDSTGANYKYGAAVKFKSVIDIDLSIDRSWNSSQFVSYRIKFGDNGRTKKLCGNNDKPALAGKLMERWR